jgi:hypothetical protein
MNSGSDAERGRGSEHHRLVADQADRHELAEQLRHLGAVGFALGQDGESRGQRHIERVAVGRRDRGGLRCDHAAAAGPVHDHDLLLPMLGEAIGEDTDDHVRSGSGPDRHNDRDRLVRVAFGQCGYARARAGQEQKSANQSAPRGATHRRSPRVPS